MDKIFTEILTLIIFPNSSDIGLTVDFRCLAKRPDRAHGQAHLMFQWPPHHPLIGPV